MKGSQYQMSLVIKMQEHPSRDVLLETKLLSEKADEGFARISASDRFSQ